MPTCRPNLSVLLVALGVWLACPTAAAQPDDLPSELVSKSGSLTDDEISRIREFAESNIQRLTSDDPAERRTARRTLREPVVGSNVSVSFRIEYGKAAREPLTRVVRAGDTQARLLALHIAGQIATEPCARIAADTLDHEEPVVRFSAAYALGLTNRVIEQRELAITPEQALQLNQRLGDRITEEQDTWILDRVILSLRAAARISKPGFERVSSTTLNILARELGNRMRRSNNPEPLSTSEVEVLLRGAEAVQQAFQEGRDLPAETIRLAAGFGGDCLAYVARAIQRGEFDDDRSTTLAQLAVTGENITFFARDTHPQARGGAAENLGIARSLTDNGNPDAFLEAIPQLTGADGILTRAPFDFPPDRFSL